MNDKIINITSNNQAGGITAHTVNSSAAPNPAAVPEKSEPGTFWKRAGIVAAILTFIGGLVKAVLAFFGK